MKVFNHTESRSGQALLMLVLVIAMVLTVVVATSFRLSTDTQQTRQQEESVRVLAAADSGIEKGIQLANSGTASDIKTFEELDLELTGIDPANSKVYITQTSGPQFVSPIIQRDDQYLFYLSNYPTDDDFFDGAINIYFGSTGVGSCGGASDRTTPALEVTLIQGAASTEVRRWLIEPCDTGEYISADSNVVTPDQQQHTIVVDNTSYAFSYDIDADTIDIAAGNSPKMLIIRSLYGTTRLALTSMGTGFSAGDDFMPQGKEIRSEARSISGTSKVVSLFQSLPQIPADFFVTTF